ncbi:MAG: orotate phosphoribosyltransferase [Oscillospiraceae bacterium]|nr:orotate phosphoribosyltransferase [Oscillospiraceae bacterium]
MDKKELARAIYETSYITGEFLLRSGQISNEYFDKYLFEARPELLGAVARVMRPLIPGGTELLAGLEMGGIPVAAALAMESGLPALYVRKRAKEYGTRKLAEGGDARGRRVCVIEDVVTTGGQIIESVKELRALGAVIDTVLCVILRGEKAAETLAREGLRLIPAFTMQELKAAAADG